MQLKVLDPTIHLPTLVRVYLPAPPQSDGLRGCHEHWRRRIEVDVLAKRMSRNPISLIDVRAPAEFQVSQIKGAFNLETASSIAKKFPAKETELVLYCSIGYRSAKLGDELKKMGYLNVWNLKGSIFEWANRGNPVHRGEVKVSTVHTYSRFWGILLDSKYHPIGP